jgi:hypothetical protein
MSIECVTPALQWIAVFCCIFSVPYVKRESLDDNIGRHKFLLNRGLISLPTECLLPRLLALYFVYFGRRHLSFFCSSVSRSRVTLFVCLLIINVDATHYSIPLLEGWGSVLVYNLPL